MNAHEYRTLQSGVWFSALSSSIRSEILRIGSFKRFRHGQLIVSCNDSIKNWYGCAAGIVRISLGNQSADLTLIDLLTPGEWSFMFPEARRNFGDYELRAYGDCSIFVLSGSSLQALLITHPELYSALTQLSCQKTIELFDRVSELRTLTARARLAKLLLRSSSCRVNGLFNSPEDDTNLVTRALTQGICAQLLGVSRQHINKFLSEMGKMNAVCTRNGRITVVNAIELAKFLSCDQA